MRAKTWIGTALLVALAAAAATALGSCQRGSGDSAVQFSSPCTDVVDPWSLMSQDERIEACQEILAENGEELKKLGFQPQDCRVTEAKVQECGIGTELACTYACRQETEP
jgi:hypothetical protein